MGSSCEQSVNWKLKGMHLNANLSAYTLISTTRNIVTRLQDVINKLVTYRPMHTTSDAAPRDGKLDTLIIPDAPETLQEDDYPDVPYWRDSDWVGHSERQKDRGEPISKLGFLTDKFGSVIVDSRIKEFTLHAKQLWNELYRHRLDPSSWTRKTPKAASFFEHEMKVKYPEFGYCDGGWKVERFAIIKYPDWCRDARESGRLTRACGPPFLLIIPLISFGLRCPAFQAQDQ